MPVINSMSLYKKREVRPVSITIISPLKSMAVIDKAIEHNDFGCVFHRYVYENLEEIKDIYEQCKDISDVLFFSGELGYSYILTHVDDLKVPCTFISYTEKTLLSILLNFVDPLPGCSVKQTLY